MNATRTTRRTFIATAAAVVAAPLPAQERWPGKAIRIITPSPPGVAPDLFARLYAGELQKSLGVAVVVDNRPGASANIGTEAVARSPGDGYTLLYGFNQIAIINPHLFTRLRFDVKRDLVPLSQTLTGSYVLAAHPGLPARDVAQLLAAARSAPGTIAYGSYGVGTLSHLGFELIESRTGVRFQHVPYARQSVLADVAAGVVSLVVEPSASAQPFLASGQLRALAVTGPRRLALLPDVPTLAETLPGLSFTGWQAFWAPAGTPREVTERLSAEVQRITRLPALAKAMADGGVEPAGTTAAELAAVIEQESAVWERVIRERNLRLDS